MNLPYFDFTTETHARWQKVLSTRPISERARQLIELCLDSLCHTSSKPTLKTRYSGQSHFLWVWCPKEVLSEALGVDVRHVYNILTQCQRDGWMAKVRERDNSGQWVTGYCMSLDLLEQLPELDPTDPLDLLILSCGGNPFKAPNNGAVHPELVDEPISGASSGGISAPISGASSGGISAPISGASSGLMSHDHDHEFMNMNERTRDIGQVEERQPSHATDCRFSEIEPRHLLGIAGLRIPVADGTEKILPPHQRVRLLDRYLADAVAAGWATDTMDDRRSLLALFHHVANRANIQNRSAYLFRCWQNRTSPGKSILNVTSEADRGYARTTLQAAGSQRPPAATAPRTDPEPAPQPCGERPKTEFERRWLEHRRRQSAAGAETSISTEIPSAP